MSEAPRDRVKPYPAVSEVVGYIFFAILAAVFVVGGIGLFYIERFVFSGFMYAIGTAAILFGAWLFYRFSRPLIFLMTTIAKRNRFNETSATARGIINRRVIEHRSNYGTTYTYEVLVKFEAVQTDGVTKPIFLRIHATKELYETLLSPLTVRYSQEDPSIAVLEGEKHFAPNAG